MINNRIKRIDKARTLSYEFISDNVKFDNELLVFFKEKLKSENMFRVLLHNSPNSDLHNMVIAMKNGSYIYPHKHVKSESYHIIKGELLLIYFENDGRIKKFIRLSNEDTIVARVDQGQFHAVIVLSEYAIYHETRVGPFDSKTDSVFADYIEENKILYMKNILNMYEGQK